MAQTDANYEDITPPWNPPPKKTGLQKNHPVTPAPPRSPAAYSSKTGPTSQLGSDCRARVDAMWMMLLQPAPAAAIAAAAAAAAADPWPCRAMKGSRASLSRKGAVRFTARTARHSTAWYNRAAPGFWLCSPTRAGALPSRGSTTEEPTEPQLMHSMVAAALALKCYWTLKSLLPAPQTNCNGFCPLQPSPTA
jgi:hypothetical protein